MGHNYDSRKLLYIVIVALFVVNLLLTGKLEAAKDNVDMARSDLTICEARADYNRRNP